MLRVELTRLRGRTAAGNSQNARSISFRREHLGPDLQNILRQSYDYLTIMPKLRRLTTDV